MKISKKYLRAIIGECIEEILLEEDPVITAPDEDPKVKVARKKVEIGKQNVEREKQKSLANKLSAAKAKRSKAPDLDTKKSVDAEIKDISNKRDASKAAQNAAIKSASSIK